MKLSGKEKQRIMNTPLNCNVCHCMLNGRKDGYYQCPKCGEIYKDNLAKVKEYLFNNPDTSFEEIIENTNVPEEALQYFIDNKLIVIPNTNKNFTTCRICGRFIVKGRFCNTCSFKTFQKIQEDLDVE